jgi:hypothetical protein
MNELFNGNHPIIEVFIVSAICLVASLVLFWGGVGIAYAYFKLSFYFGIPL